MTYEFKPWAEDHNTIKPHLLDIEDPPCRHCKFWSPQSIYYHAIDGQEFDSVRLCWVRNDAAHMQEDFSCYKPKET